MRLFFRLTLALLGVGLLTNGVAPMAAAEGSGFRRGINITRLFDTPKLRSGPVRDYDQPPFKPWREQISERELDNLRQAGFDSIRLPIDPGPLLAAAPAELQPIIDHILEFAAAARSRGFAVMLDLHTRPDSRDWNAGALLQSFEGEKFQRYDRLVGTLAGAVALRGDRGLALELFNEPQKECVRSRGPDWPLLQTKLIATARAAAPNVPLVVTGGCWSSVDGLATLDTAVMRGGEAYLMIHFYEPHAFTHQGASWSMPVRDLAGLDFPIRPEGRDIALAATGQAVAKRKDADGQSREAARRIAESTVGTYFAKPVTEAMIRDRLKIAADWADSAGIPRDHVIVGEFGVLRWGGLQALPRAVQERAKAAWLRAVVDAVEMHGFGWAVWGYDGAFGIVSNDQAKVLEPYTLQALFPRR